MSRRFREGAPRDAPVRLHGTGGLYSYGIYAVKSYCAQQRI